MSASSPQNTKQVYLSKEKLTAATKALKDLLLNAFTVDELSTEGAASGSGAAGGTSGAASGSGAAGGTSGAAGGTSGGAIVKTKKYRTHKNNSYRKQTRKNKH